MPHPFPDIRIPTGHAIEEEVRNGAYSKYLKYTFALSRDCGGEYHVIAVAVAMHLEITSFFYLHFVL